MDKAERNALKARLWHWITKTGDTPEGPPMTQEEREEVLALYNLHREQARPNPVINPEGW